MTQVVETSMFFFKIPSKLTAKAPENGGLEDEFLFGAETVSFREGMSQNEFNFPKVRDKIVKPTPPSECVRI